LFIGVHARRTTYTNVQKFFGSFFQKRTDPFVGGQSVPGTGDNTLVISTLTAAEPLYREFQATGAPLHQTVRSEPWGAKTFIVREPDGNLIRFAAAAA
jgi:uncharacterized glyoxalase superfamily protein PhnB